MPRPLIHNIGRRDRLMILEQLADRSRVKQVLNLADIYLDSYRYAGANSTVGPLEIGLPTVVREGNSLRSRQGAALLRELELFDLQRFSDYLTTDKICM